MLHYLRSRLWSCERCLAKFGFTGVRCTLLLAICEYVAEFIIAELRFAGIDSTMVDMAWSQELMFEERYSREAVGVGEHSLIGLQYSFIFVSFKPMGISKHQESGLNPSQGAFYCNQCRWKCIRSFQSSRI